MEIINFNGVPNYFKKKDHLKSFSMMSNEKDVVINTTSDDIIDVVTGNEFIPIQVKKIVHDVSKNVVGISSSKRGLPIATGYLIHPEFIITSTDTISPNEDEMDIQDLSICLGFEKTLIKLDDGSNKFTEIMNFGKFINIKSIYEYNSVVGYCILKLKKSIPESYPWNPFVSLNDKIENPINNDELLYYFSHQNGGPKKVIFGTNLPIEERILNQDSIDGESGGVYSNQNGVIIGINTLVEINKDGDEFKCNLLNFKDILSNSKLLKELYPNNGVYSPPAVIKSQAQDEEFIISPKDHLVLVTRGNYPGPKANHNNQTDPYVQFSYHHIIPAGYMEFLWMLSKEFEMIKDVLSEIYKHDALINYTVWSNFNLFKGPSSRYNKKELLKLLEGETNIHGWDPASDIEPYKPISFSSKQWEFVQDFYLSLEKCWKLRNQLTNLSKEETIRWIDQNYNKPNFQDMVIDQINPISTNEYKDSLNVLSNKLNQSKSWLTDITKVFEFEPSDWILVKKYYLK